jgi:hypothetical protein
MASTSLTVTEMAFGGNHHSNEQRRLWLPFGRRLTQAPYNLDQRAFGSGGDFTKRMVPPSPI